MRDKAALVLRCLIAASCLGSQGIARETCDEPGGRMVLAIIDTSGVDDTLATVTSVVTAKLSNAPNITLVERQDIDRVLDELALSASQLASRENSVKLGKLLGQTA